MHAPSDLYCLLGPEFGFNRHVLLFSPTIDKPFLEWGLPWREVVERLFQMLDVPFLEEKEAFTEYGARRASPLRGAPSIALRSLILSKARFADLTERMRVREITRFKMVEYRVATGKKSDVDWLSEGVLRYVFDHLPK